MHAELNQTIDNINDIIRRELWFDFHVISYDGTNLILAGGVDLTYNHTLEIVFHNIFYLSAFFQGWHSDTKHPVLALATADDALNSRLEIEQGYQVFVLKTEDYRNNVIVAAENIFYNTDTVYYYERENLQPNERIADCVQRKK